MKEGLFFIKEGVSMKSKEERDAIRTFIQYNILTSKEVTDLLGFSRERLRQLVNGGKITPIRKGLGIYLKDDILAFKEERRSE